MMATEELQKFIFKQIQDVKKITKASSPNHPEYSSAMNDVVVYLEAQRAEILAAHKVLKEAGIL